MKIKNLAIIILMITILTILSTKVEATTGKINTETVRLRKEPNTKSTILEQLDKNDEVEILEEEEDWYKVTVKVEGQKITGYVSKSLVDVENTSTQGEPKTSSSNENTSNSEETLSEQQPIENEKTTTTEIEDIEVNKEYALTQEIKIKTLPLINSIEKSAISSGNVKITEIINDWCQIENDTLSGWVRKNQLKKVITVENEVPADTVPVEKEPETKPEETQPEETQPEETNPSEDEKPQTTEKSNTTVTELNKTGYVSADGLRVRKEPTTSSDEVDILKKNDQVTITGEVNGWYKIKYKDTTGYVSSKYISDTKIAETTSRGMTPSQSNSATTTTDNSEIEEEKQETSSSETKTTGADIVEYAKQYLGYKYVSGGSTPSTGFDCSGFTTYIYKHFGISLSRTSKGQNSNGVAVEKSNLQLGDILVFNDDANKSIGHVGIYVGNGNFIHASNPSDGVKITALSSDYYAKRYVGARRVIN